MILYWEEEKEGRRQWRNIGNY